MTQHDIRITSKGGTHHVVLDGVDVSTSLASASWSAGSYGEPAHVVLDVITDTGEVDGQAVVTIPDAAAALLEQLGWTPPGGEA